MSKFTLTIEDAHGIVRVRQYSRKIDAVNAMEKSVAIDPNVYGGTVTSPKGAVVAGIVVPVPVPVEAEPVADEAPAVEAPTTPAAEPTKPAKAKKAKPAAKAKAKKAEPKAPVDPSAPVEVAYLRDQTDKSSTAHVMVRRTDEGAFEVSNEGHVFGTFFRYNPAGRGKREMTDTGRLYGTTTPDGTRYGWTTRSEAIRVLVHGHKYGEGVESKAARRAELAATKEATKA